jgi:hypothetical protein
MMPRLDAAGVLNHILNRGIERRVIFRDDSDRENLVLLHHNQKEACQTVVNTLCC